MGGKRRNRDAEGEKRGGRRVQKGGRREGKRRKR